MSFTCCRRFTRLLTLYLTRSKHTLSNSMTVSTACLLNLTHLALETFFPTCTQEMCDSIVAKTFFKSPTTFTASLVTSTKPRDEFAAAILAVTNSRRARHGAQPLVWDDNLATAAMNWAKNCIFDDSPDQYGGNVAASGINPDVGALADEWYSYEACSYDYANPRFLTSTGHFSQVVWAGTTRMGCALVQESDACPNGITVPEDPKRIFNGFLNCEYYPPGNITGYFSQNVLPPNPAFSCSGTKLLNS